MLEFIKRNRMWLAAGGLLVILVVLLSVRSGRSTQARMIDETLNAVAHPFQTGFSKTVSWISVIFDRYFFLVRM